MIVVALMAGYVQARSWAGKLDGVRRLSFDNPMLFWLYTCGQGLVGVVLLHGVGRLLS